MIGDLNIAFKKRCNGTFIITIFLLIFFSQEVKGQKTTRFDGLRFHSIMTSFDFSSNTGLFGMYNIEQKQPSYSPSVSYFSKYGFDISAMGFIVANSDPTFSKATYELDMVAGYEWGLGKYLKFYPNYAHYFNFGESNSIKSIYSDNIQLDVSFEYKFFTSMLTGSYLFGKQQSPFVSFQNYVLFEADKFIFDGLYVAIQPGIDITWGNPLNYQKIVLDYFLENPDRLDTFIKRHWRLNRFVRNIKKTYPDLDNSEIFKRLIEWYIPEDEGFKINSLTLLLPIYVMFDNFSVNVSGMYYKPVNVSEYYNDEGQIYFSVGVSYSFLW